MCACFSLRVYYVLFLDFSSSFLVSCLLSRGSRIFLFCGVGCVACCLCAVCLALFVVVCLSCSMSCVLCVVGCLVLVVR